MISKIAATIILYHPDKHCLNNIRSYLPFVEKIYAIDNSETVSDIAEIRNIDKISYLPIGKNSGMAAALNLACKKAKADGYEWLLTMDQDSSFANDHFFKAIKTVDDASDIAIISPNHDWKIKETESFETEQRDIIMTSGNLLNLSLYDKIGGFNDDLFIDEVDHDYCLRARLLNYKIICFPSIILQHELGYQISKRGKTISAHKPYRYYYMTRNNFYVFKKYGKAFPIIIRKRKIYLYKEILGILRFQDDKIKKIGFAIAGYKDYRRGRFGKM